MIRRPPRSTQSSSSAASDVYKRQILECAGYIDIISKCIGSRTAVNVVRAVFDGLDKLLDAQEVAKNRGKSLKDMWS